MEQNEVGIEPHVATDGHVILHIRPRIVTSLTSGWAPAVGQPEPVPEHLAQAD